MMISGSTIAGGTPRSLRVLLVEDSPADAILLARTLKHGGFEASYERVDTRDGMLQALQKQTWDLVLADHSMPNFSAPEALALVKQHGLDVPFIIVSGLIDEAIAVEAMRSGAHDYVMKDRLARLVPVVERELREAEVRRARSHYEAQLRRAHEELELRVAERTADLMAANVKLENAIEERKRLENELLEIAENERRRIGFDLHDDLGQKLAGLSLMAKGLENRLAAERHPSAGEAQRIQSLINELVRHTHDLAHQFSSLDMQGDDLSDLLKALAGNVKQVFALPCSVMVKGAIPDLSSHTIIQLCKIAQEAISNAIKHGRTGKVAMALTRNEEALVLTIRNDGLPFSVPTGRKGRMGLRIMNFRANSIGASLKINALGKKGTLVTCRLPVRNVQCPPQQPPPPPPPQPPLKSSSDGMRPNSSVLPTY